MAYANNIITETKKHLRRYEYDEVIDNCKKILEVDSRSGFGLRFLAIAYYQTGKYKQALEYYYRLLEKYPDDIDARYSIAKINEELGNYSDALSFYDKLAKTEETLSKRKRLLTKMKRYEQIISEYDQQLSEIRNTKSECNIKRKIVLLEEKAIFHYRNEEFEKAYHCLKEVFPLYETVEEHNYNKKEFDVWYTFVNNCITGSTDAMKFFDNFLDIKKNMEIWLKKIRHNFSDYEDRLVFTDLLMEVEAKNVELLENIATSVKYVDSDYSLNCWKRILELEPENTQAIIAILDIYSTMYAKDKQLELIDSKIHIDDIRLDLLVRKIKLLESMTLYDEALKAYDEYLSIEKPEGLINHPLTIFDRMRCMEQQALELYLDNRLDESYNILLEVSRIYSNTQKNPCVIKTEEWILDDWYNVILIDSINESHDDSERFYEQFYNVNEKSIEYWMEKIEFLISWQHFGNPVTYCNILLNKSDNNIKILLLKGLVYYRTSRLDSALDVYNEVLDIDADNDEAKNHKFNILVQKHEYKRSYKLLQSMNMNYVLISNYLNNLAREFFNKREYELALNCYKRILEENLSFDTVDQIKIILDKLGDKNSLERCKYYMDWINLIKSMHDPEICPECGKNLIPIIYGYPMPGMLDSEKNGVEYILGGCCVGDDSPTHYCNHCEKSMNMEEYGIEIAKDDPDLYYYCKSKIMILSRTIEEHPLTITQLKKVAYPNGVFEDEFMALIEKLKQIGHIKQEENNLKVLNRASKKPYPFKRKITNVEKYLFDEKITRR